MGAREEIAKFYTAKRINGLSENFKAMREARVTQERETEMFDLKKKEAQLKLKAAENDPSIDPGLVSMKRKNLELGFQQEENRLKIAQKQLDYQMADSTTQMRQLGDKAKQLNQLTHENPEMFGDLMIVPDLETGTVTLKPKVASEVKARSDIKKNESEVLKNNAAVAKQMATDGFGRVDELKFQQYLKDLNATGAPATAASTAPTPAAAAERVVPDWVPKGREDQYKTAKQYYSDDEIKKHLGAA